ncbi:MAG: UDP-N-acetylmuramate--L-alanine ligase [Ruminococcaceae bacterium]|nr:UDP-N-acetylmuramate--L-alanine ligase [Oscillospiraceae bacterium]
MVLIMSLNCKFSLKNVNKSKTVLFAGIGGISMSALAQMLLRDGYIVSGYDMKRTALTEKMELMGIEIAYEFEDIVFENVGLVVYTKALSDDHYVLVKARENGITAIDRPVLLGEIMKNDRRRIGIAGTHGKSTSTGMLSQIFLSDPTLDPTIMIGAQLPAMGDSYRVGRGGDFIFEACEYKDAFLDFCPNIAVVLNVELDHTDYFSDIDDMTESFADYISKCGKNGVAIVNGDNANAVKASLMARENVGKILYFSAQTEADIYADNIVYDKGYAEFDICISGDVYAHAKLNIPGKFNISNALAVAGAAYVCGIPRSAVEKGMAEFGGVNRRFERRCVVNGAVVIDDYAHHPDEIRATVSTACAISNRVIAVFQPHTYTRTRDLFDDITKAFAGCHQVIFADIYSAREADIYGINSKMLADATPNALYLGGFEEIGAYLRSVAREGDIILIMGAGDINKLVV